MNATATAKTTTNGRRPTLSDSIARLDQILDGLGEAIPQTIRETLRDSVAAAVAEGVRAALVEVLSGEAVQSLLRGVLSAASAPAAAPPPSLGQQLMAQARSALATVRAWVGGTLQRVAGGLATVGPHDSGRRASGLRLAGVRRALAPAAPRAGARGRRGRCVDAFGVGLVGEPSGRSRGGRGGRRGPGPLAVPAADPPVRCPGNLRQSGDAAGKGSRSGRSPPFACEKAVSPSSP